MGILRGKIVICYSSLMHDEIMPVASFFELRLKWLLPSAAVVFVAALIMNSQKMLLQLPGPAKMATALIFFLAVTCHLAGYLTDKCASHLKISYPTVILWLYPTIAMMFITLSAWVFIIISNRIFGRGFWSDWLGLTGQDTTSFFFACFSSMIVFVALQFAFSMINVLRWIIDMPHNHLQTINASINPFSNNVKQEIGDALEQAKSASEKIKENRSRATRLNRFALLTMVLLAAAAGAWIVFFRPELILYYRAEIQLRTFLEPESALETFRHLSKKYPKYRFLDTVNYRMAWILDRRLSRFDEAATEYEKFLKNYGTTNVWADEATAALVRLNFDKLCRPGDTLFWADEYMQKFPNGVMFLHMLLYKIRALHKNDEPIKAMAEFEKARTLYANRQIQIISSEDRMIDLISFADALAAEQSLFIPE